MKVLDYSQLLSMTKHHQDLEFFVLDGVWRATLPLFCGVQTMQEDVVSLTMLPLYGERNTMPIVLEEEDEAKIQFLRLSCQSLKRPTIRLMPRG